MQIPYGAIPSTRIDTVKLPVRNSCGGDLELTSPDQDKRHLGIAYRERLNILLFC